MLIFMDKYPGADLKTVSCPIQLFKKALLYFIPGYHVRHKSYAKLIDCELFEDFLAACFQCDFRYDRSPGQIFQQHVPETAGMRRQQQRDTGQILLRNLFFSPADDPDEQRNRVFPAFRTGSPDQGNPSEDSGNKQYPVFLFSAEQGMCQA